MHNEERRLLVVDIVEVNDADGWHQLQDVEAIVDGQAAVIKLAAPIALLLLTAGVTSAGSVTADFSQLVDGQQADIPARQNEVKITLQGLLDFCAHQGVQAKVSKGGVWVDLAHILHTCRSEMEVSSFCPNCFAVTGRH